MYRCNIYFLDVCSDTRTKASFDWEGSNGDFPITTSPRTVAPGYVKTRQATEEVGESRPVAGFVVVVYNDRATYVVKKLQ